MGKTSSTSNYRQEAKMKRIRRGEPAGLRVLSKKDPRISTSW